MGPVSLTLILCNTIHWGWVLWQGVYEPSFFIRFFTLYSRIGNHAWNRLKIVVYNIMSSYILRKNCVILIMGIELYIVRGVSKLSTCSLHVFCTRSMYFTLYVNSAYIFRNITFKIWPNKKVSGSNSSILAIKKTFEMKTKHKTESK